MLTTSIKKPSPLPILAVWLKRGQEFILCLLLILHVGNLLATGVDAEAATSQGPFQSGCLYALKPEWEKKRVCNSEDSQDAIRKGICRVPSISYPEIRIVSPNWESGFLQSWMLQIILSELLDVPTTIETGTPDAYLNFFDPQERVEYGISIFDTLALENAHQQPNGDCTLAKSSGVEYVPCGHYLPEIWHSNHKFYQDLVRRGISEPQEGTGLVGYEGWFVPKFTGAQDPSLLHYLGLEGEQNRHKLAESFLWPTTWSEYCERVSMDDCQTPGSTAQRPPKGEDEYDKFFVDGLYTGHFRMTEQNNCTMNPTNCTGHIADFPMDWVSFTFAQLHHLGIALERGNGKEGVEINGVHSYSYSELTQLWMAANATKSNLIMMWWSPELLYQRFQNTDAEFVPIGMPAPTEQCFEHRITEVDRKSEDPEIQAGSPLGVCGEAARPLKKGIASVVVDTIYNPEVPHAIRSPGYDVLDDFTLSNTQLDEAFKKWFSDSSPRHAVCEWIIENMEHMERFVPETYPRTLELERNDALIYAGITLGAISVLLVSATAYGVHLNRNEKVMRFAQVNFLFILLSGSMLISIGAIVLGSPSTDATCVAAVWYINIGYTLELVPLLIKISAINRLLSAAQKMRRLRVNRASLYGGVVVINVFVVIFLLLWTSLDPPQVQQEYVLTDHINVNNETIVSNTEYCSSKSPIWSYVAVGWNALLLLIATVLAFQARSLSSPYNESGTLGILIYSHFVFVLLRIATFFLSSNIRASVLEAVRSILFSIDTMATMFIYFLPKFMFRENSGDSAVEQSRGFSPATRGLLVSRIVSNITMVSKWGKEEEDIRDDASSQDGNTTDGKADSPGGGRCPTENAVTSSTGQQTATNSIRICGGEPTASKLRRVMFAPDEDEPAINRSESGTSAPEAVQQQLEAVALLAKLRSTVDDQNETIQTLQDELHSLRSVLLKADESIATTSVVEA